MTQQEKDKYYLLKAINMAKENVQQGKGGPFAAIIVKSDEIVATGTNVVTSTNDPTAHAEVTAIRNACAALSSFQLEDCTIYASCEPCPMCLGAIYWARPVRLVFAADKYQAAAVGFDDAFIYKEIALAYGQRHLPTTHVVMNESDIPMQEWKNTELKTEY